MTNTFDGLTNILDMPEEIISGPEYRAIETFQTEIHKEKRE